MGSPSLEPTGRTRNSSWQPSRSRPGTVTPFAAHAHGSKHEPEQECSLLLDDHPPHLYLCCSDRPITAGLHHVRSQPEPPHRRRSPPRRPDHGSVHRDVRRHFLRLLSRSLTPSTRRLDAMRTDFVRYTPDTAPATTEEGQTGTNACGTGSSQTSNCQVRPSDSCPFLPSHRLPSSSYPTPLLCRLLGVLTSFGMVASQTIGLTPASTGLSLLASSPP